MLIGPDLRVVALGSWLPQCLGTSAASCVGKPVSELLQQLERAGNAAGLAHAFDAALENVRGTHSTFTTASFHASLASEASETSSLRLVLTPLLAAGGELHGIALAVEDTGQFARAQHQALLALRTELEQEAGSRTADLESANANLLLEIAEHMKTEKSLRDTQEQLHHAQRLEAVGRLAGGIAHDFNNLLSIVLGYSMSIMAELAEDSALHADLAEIRRAGDRAAELTRQLLAFGRQQVLEPRVLDLNEVTLRMDRMMRRVLGEDIDIVTLPGKELWQTKLDPGQIEQVIVNLLINARDAMPHGGTLTLETNNQFFDADYAHAHVGASPGAHVVLAVSDTGAGMSRETQARAFEPFFTTKQKGKGTGLGLATVFGSVKQSGGHIWLYSEIGKGTTFKLCFPRCTDAITGASYEPVRVEPQAVPRGTETILLVEDDAQLRNMARAILLRLGYRVLDAADGVEALKLIEQERGEIQLLLTDVVMPHMNGRELARRLADTRPLTKVLYMSGYTDNAIVHNGILDHGVAYLQKPLTPDALARKVRQVLDTPLSDH
jgi:two-component system cell cycle sensor histidine kinase/response regulator CckA